MAERDLLCRVCGAEALATFSQFEDLPRVTSDCRPFPAGGRLAICGECAVVQKPVDARLLSEAAAIYDAYDVYFQSDGVEQAVFDPTTGAPRRRSAVLVDKLAESRTIAENGRLIDVGCGKGALLSAFADSRPGWELFGHDLSEANRALLSRIAGFRRLYSGPVDALPGDFDLMTLIHSLEHFIEPCDELADLRSKLASGGCLFIEVPDAEATPFDLLIADHVTHFTASGVARLLARAGFAPLLVANNWVAKELSVIAEPGAALNPSVSSAPARRQVEAQLAWLRELVTGADRAASGARRFGLFGTSIAAMWLFGEVGDAVEFFVDEDPSRRNRQLLGRPILHPADIPADATVFMPLIPSIAGAVAARLSGSGVDYRLPPGLPAT